MKTKLLFVVLFSLCEINNIIAQDASYTINTYRNGNEILSLAISDSYIFIGTSNGIYQRNYDGDIITIHNTEKGLLNNMANAIYVRDNDNIWFATPKGLHLYNDNKYLIFDQTSGLLNNTINSICSDNEGNIWVANFSGLSQFKDNIWSTYTIPYVAPDTITFNSIIYNSGLLWGATLGYGLYSFNGSDWTIYNTSNGLTDNNLVSLRNDTSNVLWAATSNNGLIEYNDGWIHHSNNILNGRTINNFVIDKYNTKWIFTDNGVIKLNQNTWSIPDSLAKFHTKTGSIDDDNNLWLLTDNQLIKYMPVNDSIARFKVDGLLNNAISSIYIDNDNVKWICNADGISKLNVDWTNINYKEINSSLNKFYITGADQDLNKKIWLSYDYSGEGILSFDGQTWKTYKSPDNNLHYGYITALAADSNNYVWIGYYGFGMWYFDGEKWNESVSTNDLPSQYVNYITVDKKNNKWIGTNMGISKYDGNSFENFAVAKNISGIAFDSENKIWASTWGPDDSGLVMFNGSDWKIFTVDSGLTEKYVRKVLVDKYDNVWCGYDWSGVSIYNQREHTWKKFTAEDGLANNQILALTIDDSNNIFVGTPNGLSIISPSTVSFKLMAKKNNLKSTSIKINVPVSVESFNKIKHVEFTLHFDQNILKFSSINRGGLYGINMDDFDLSDTLNGNISFDYKNDEIVCQSINNGIAICNLSFEVKDMAPDSSEISLSNIIVENYKNEKLSNKANSAKFKINDWINLTDINEKPDFGSILNLYPNPAKDLFSIECKEKINSLRIYDISGKIISQINTFYEEPVTINVHELKQGIYMVKIVTVSGEKTIKFVKE